MRKLSTKWVQKFPNADQKRQSCQSSEQILELFWRDPNDFLSRLVTTDETWLYHYDPEAKQQSIQWWHSDSPRRKKTPSAKIHWKNYHLDIFLGIKTPSSSLITFQRAKLSTRSITHLCWRNWRIFWRKNAVRNSPSGSCSYTTLPRLSGHL